MYAQGPGGVLLHSSVIDVGDGNYTVSAWPVVSGAYHVSVLVSALEPSQWALGYRQGTDRAFSTTNERRKISPKVGHPQAHAVALESD